MEKYSAVYNNRIQQMCIIKINEIGLNHRCEFEKARNTYNSVEIFDTVEECIESLGGYSRSVLLFDGREIIPDAINFPKMESYYILKPVRFPLTESIADSF